MLTLTAVACLVAAPGKPEANTLQKQMQGTWKVAKMSRGGNDAPPAAIQGLSLTFKGDKAIISRKPDDPATVKIDATKSPAHITLSPKKKKDQMFGIVRIKGDKMTLCLTEGKGAESRPKKFDSSVSPGVILIEFERVKK